VGCDSQFDDYYVRPSPLGRPRADSNTIADEDKIILTQDIIDLIGVLREEKVQPTPSMIRKLQKWSLSWQSNK
jgi:hypothetical protein